MADSRDWTHMDQNSWHSEASDHIGLVSEGGSAASVSRSSLALQVSVCTGVTQRVSLFELLADVAEAFVQNCVPPRPSWGTLLETHRVGEKFSAPDFWTWHRSELEYDLQAAVVQIVSFVINTLATIGVDQTTNELVIAWVLEHDPFNCIRACGRDTNLWTRILADSRDCATFAYMTTRCFQASDAHVSEERKYNLEARNCISGHSCHLPPIQWGTTPVGAVEFDSKYILWDWRGWLRACG